jgi:hypothetical protein
MPSGQEVSTYSRPGRRIAGFVGTETVIQLYRAGPYLIEYPDPDDDLRN